MARKSGGLRPDSVISPDIMTIGSSGLDARGRPDDLATVHIAEVEVDERDSEIVLRNHIDRTEPLHAGSHAVPVPGQQMLDGATNRRLIIDDENVAGAVASPRCIAGLLIAIARDRRHRATPVPAKPKHAGRKRARNIAHCNTCCCSLQPGANAEFYSVFRSAQAAEATRNKLCTTTCKGSTAKELIFLEYPRRVA